MSDIGRASAESYKVGYMDGRFNSWAKIWFAAIVLAILGFIAYNSRPARIVVDTQAGYRCEQSCGGTYLYCKKL